MRALGLTEKAASLISSAAVNKDLVVKAKDSPLKAKHWGLVLKEDFFKSRAKDWYHWIANIGPELDRAQNTTSLHAIDCDKESLFLRNLVNDL